MLIVADASPLIFLGGLGLLDLLPSLYARIVTTREVLLEVTSGEEERPGSGAVRRAQWLEIQEPGSTESALRATLESELDPGEASAIALARSLRAELLLIDERQGRRIARQLGVQVRGTCCT